MNGIAIIPARGGSIRIPRKNIKLINGLPAIAHTIRVLQISNQFSQIWVTSDDDEILDVSRKHGANLVLKRSHELSGGDIPTIPVIQDALSTVSINPDTPICTVYPVNPLILVETLGWTHRILLTHPDASYVSTVVRFGFPIQRSLATSGKFLQMIDPKMKNMMSQDLEPRYHETGQFWWGRAETWLKGVPMQDSLLGLELPEFCQQDVDNPSDWELMEIKLRYLSNPLNRENCLKLIPSLGINSILFSDSGINLNI